MTPEERMASLDLQIAEELAGLRAQLGDLRVRIMRHLKVLRANRQLPIPGSELKWNGALDPELSPMVRLARGLITRIRELGCYDYMPLALDDLPFDSRNDIWENPEEHDEE